MKEFETLAKEWGDSLGVVIPKEIVEEEGIKPKKKITVFVMGKKPNLRKIFGTLKFKKSAQEIKNEMRKGWKPGH